MTQERAEVTALPPAPVDARRFRDGMSRLAAAVHVVATDGPAGRAGMTVTAVTSVTDTPATLIVCVNSDSHFCGVVEKNGVFSVNLLGSADRHVAEAFGGPGRLPWQRRFEIGSWQPGRTGAPVLAHAMVAFDCTLSGSDTVATHRLVLGRVVDMRLGPASDALLYWNRGYRHLPVDE